MAFLSFVKSKRTRYVYLTEYCGRQQHSSKRTVNIYSLGKHDEALFTLQAWDLNYDNFPDELKQKGYTKVDLKKWISYLKNSRQEAI